MAGGEGVSAVSPKLGRKTRRTDWLQANKWTFYEAPLSEKQSEKSSGNGENNLVLIAPRWSLKSRVCKRQCWRTCYLKKKCNRLGVERKKIESAHKDIQYPIQPIHVLPMWFCGEREREKKKIRLGSLQKDESLWASHESRGSGAQNL